MRTRNFSTMDVYLAAFLSLNGKKPFLKVVTNNRVIFEFPDDDIYEILSKYNENVSIPVADFVVGIKALRGRMLQLRGLSTERQKR